MSGSGKHDTAMETLDRISGAGYLICRTTIPVWGARKGRYLARFVRTHEDLDSALKLRFEVFNLELGEGLESSFQTNRDLDKFDEACHHLIVLDTEQNQVVGTYRMQTSEMAAAANGFYTATEFDLSRLPSRALNNAVELGRACVAQAHRNAGALFMLWKGLAAYLTLTRKRHLFGCCSLTSQDADEGWQVFRSLEQQGHLHPSLVAPPRPGYECAAEDGDFGEATEVKLPRLFRTYLRYGAKVCSPPAIDRQFKTIDFLAFFDVAEMDVEMAKLFF